MPTAEKTFLQQRIEEALGEASRARDHYDRILQERLGTKGKPIYDIQRGKSKKPSADLLNLIAELLGKPASFFTDSGVPGTNVRPFEMEGRSSGRLRRDVPIFGTGLGAEEVVEGVAIEQTRLNTGDIVGYLKRPPILEGRADVYGIYVQGSSMHPRFHDGDPIFVERKKPARIGDDVVVYLRVPDDVEGELTSCVLVKTLVRKSGSYLELEQYQPEKIFRIDMERVQRIDRVIPLVELIS